MNSCLLLGRLLYLYLGQPTLGILVAGAGVSFQLFDGQKCQEENPALNIVEDGVNFLVQGPAETDELGIHGIHEHVSLGVRAAQSSPVTLFGIESTL